MCEPVMRRTSFDARARQGMSAFGLRSPLAKALSLFGALSLLTAAALPVQAESAPASVYSIVSQKARESLLTDVVLAGKRLVAVGDRGHILFSDDNGVSWTQAKVPSRQMLTSLFFVSPQKGWAVGHDAQILHTSDAGATWTVQFEDLEREAPLLDIWFQNEQHGLAVGAYGALLETTDGGQNWEDVSDRLDNEDGYHLNSIAAITDSGLFVVGEQGSMFRSADWGTTWETVKGPYEGSLFGVSGNGASAGVLVYGLRGHLFRSTDFGGNWQQVELSAANGPLEFGLSGASLLSDGSLVIVGHGGSVLKSTDAGRNFSVLNRSDRLSLSSVSAAADGNLILVGQGGAHVASPTGASLDQQ